jgi:hypothetical protein
VGEVYGIGDDEAGRQVDAWAISLPGVEPTPRLDSDPSAYPPGRHAESTYNGTASAAETRNGGRDEGGESWRSPQHPLADGGVFDNPGQEFGEHDRPGGQGMPGNQAGGRDPGPVPVDDAHDVSGASAGARMPGNSHGASASPGSAGRGSG